MSSFDCVPKSDFPTMRQYSKSHCPMRLNPVCAISNNHGNYVLPITASGVSTSSHLRRFSSCSNFYPLAIQSPFDRLTTNRTTKDVNGLRLRFTHPQLLEIWNFIKMLAYALTVVSISACAEFMLRIPRLFNGMMEGFQDGCVYPYCLLMLFEHAQHSCTTLHD